MTTELGRDVNNALLGAAKPVQHTTLTGLGNAVGGWAHEEAARKLWLLPPGPGRPTATWKQEAELATMPPPSISSCSDPQWL